MCYSLIRFKYPATSARMHLFSVAYGGDLKVSLVHWFPMSGVTLLKGHTINLWSHDMINGR